ncbi:MAG: hypothetical protein AB1633_12580, partial [Elusimicrobiota bacterium]
SKVWNSLTPESKKIQRIILNTADGISKREAGMIAKHLSVNFIDSVTRSNAQTLKAFFAHIFQQRISFDFSYIQENLSIKNDSAVASFKVQFNDNNGNPIFNWTDYYPDSRIFVLFVKEKGRWRIRTTAKLVIKLR